ncbi:MAG: hypothetical protein R3C03_18620 [Pirellulaceae bacterium]
MDQSEFLRLWFHLQESPSDREAKRSVAAALRASPELADLIAADELLDSTLRALSQISTSDETFVAQLKERFLHEREQANNDTASDSNIVAPANRPFTTLAPAEPSELSAANLRRRKSRLPAIISITAAVVLVVFLGLAYRYWPNAKTGNDNVAQNQNTPKAGKRQNRPRRRQIQSTNSNRHSRGFCVIDVVDEVR